MFLLASVLLLVLLVLPFALGRIEERMDEVPNDDES